ncbi:unnamed protein product, partial [Laminaria digitata]
MVCGAPGDNLRRSRRRGLREDRRGDEGSLGGGGNERLGNTWSTHGWTNPQGDPLVNIEREMDSKEEHVMVLKC